MVVGNSQQLSYQGKFETGTGAVGHSDASVFYPGFQGSFALNARNL